MPNEQVIDNVDGNLQQEVLTNPVGRQLGATRLAQEGQQSTEQSTEGETSDPQPNNNNDDDWYIMEGVKGEGAKPEWFNNKTFKTMADQAKSVVELRKALGERTGSPEDYTIDLGEDYKDFPINEDDALMTFWKDFSKKAKMPQELFNEGIKGWLDYVKSIQEDRANTFKDSLDKMGAKGEEELNNIETWFNNNFPDHSFDNFKLMLQTPDDLQLIKEMKDKMSASASINTKDITPRPTQNKEYWQNKMNKADGYGRDMEKTRQIDAEFERFVASGGKI